MVVELKVPLVPPEMTHGMAHIPHTMCAMVIQSMVDRYGSEEAQKMIYPRLKEMGKQMAGMAPQMGITGKDAMAIASLLHFFESHTYGLVGEPTEVGPDRVVKEITKCPFQNLSVDYCLSFRGLADGIAEGINPEYKWTLSKLIPKGDPVCQWIVQKK